MKKVAFEALIKEVKALSLVSGDKSARITLQVDAPTDDLMKAMMELHRPDAMVAVAIAEMGR